MNLYIRLCIGLLALNTVSLSHAIEVVFFWGNNATPSIDISGRDWVTPSPTYMSAAANARYGRLGAGDYAFDHVAIPDGESLSAVVLMKPYGSDALCNVRYVYETLCYNRFGNRQNTRFLYFWATAKEDEADLLSYGRVGVHGGLPALYQFGTYQEGGVSQIATGLYDVYLGEAATTESSVQVQQSDVHGSNINCNPLWWYAGRVRVQCNHRFGYPVDSGFRLIAASGRKRANHNRALFDVATQRLYGSRPRLDNSFSQASDNSLQSVTRTRLGHYRVKLGPSASTEGHVQVTSMDYNGAECHVVGFGSGYANIACTRNGVNVDVPFTMMGATPLTGTIYPRP